MTKIRDELIRTLWRGKDPFAENGSYDGDLDLQGGGSQHPYLRDAIEKSKPRIIVAIGVWKGGSTIYMASYLRDLAIDGVVIAIDTWLGAWDHWANDQWFNELGLINCQPNLFQKFCNNVRKAGLTDYVVPIPLDSNNAAEVLQYFKIKPDMVHIDAGHDYQAVTSHLRQWWPVLKPGGILIGDDYREGNAWPDVKRAFDDYFEELGLTPIQNTSDKCQIMKPIEDDAVGVGPVSAGLAPRPATFEQVAAEVHRWREACRLEFDALVTDRSIGRDDLVRRYVEFTGPNWIGIRRGVMDRIAGNFRDMGLDCSRHDLFTADGRVRADGPSETMNSMSAAFLKPGTIEEFQVHELLPASSNPFRMSALPNPINKNMARSDRPPLNAYRGKELDLFVSPLGYQLCDEQRGIFWPEASTRAYSSKVFGLKHRDIDNPVVIVQDTFEGTNFSHFLFDWLPRLAHFLEAGIEDSRRLLILMGGAPGAFHSRLITSMCVFFHLAPDQFVFPASPEIWHLKDNVYFFSDVKIDIMHPAHMAHERSIDLIRRLTGSIRTSRRTFPRIYISRADTPLRQVANEGELWQQLKKLGFVMIWLSRLSLQEQIEVVRGANVIVAPHGMGLTHIAFHDAKPLIVELHHPETGTDAYAFVAHAFGFRYRSIIGKDMNVIKHHFSIDQTELLAILNEENVLPPEISSTDGAANFSPRMLWQGGVQEEKVKVVAGMDQMQRSGEVLRHVRGARPDNNLGWIEVSNLADGLVYSVACDVWIPKEFRGKDITFSSREFRRTPISYANMNCRDEWQTLRVNGVAKSEVANVVLRSTTGTGEVFYSTSWRVSLGTGA